MEGFKVQLKQLTGLLMWDVLIYQSLPNGDTELFNHLFEGTILPKYGAYVEPTFRIPENVLPVLMEALSKNGVKLPEKAFIEGKLEATERHLEDMRTLVFQEEIIINEKSQ